MTLLELLIALMLFSAWGFVLVAGVALYFKRKKPLALIGAGVGMLADGVIAERLRMKRKMK